MKKRIARITAIVAAAIILVGFILFQSNILNRREGPKENSAPGNPAADSGAPQAIPVRAIIVEKGALKDFIFVNGSTAPNEEVAISSEVPGKVQRILFKEGALVNKGVALVQLDDAELQAERRRLVVQQELNQRIAERLKALYDKEGVSLQEYEVAKAEAEKVKAEIALIDVQIEKRTIRAPFSGRLGLRLVSEGSYISPGLAIVSLISINPIKLEFSVPEKYSRAVGSGTIVKFQMDGYDGDYDATVVAVEPNIDLATRTFRLKATAPNPGGKIIPGAFAKVIVNLRKFDDAIMVPTEAIVPEQNEKKVFVYRSGIAQSVTVETGIRQESAIQVLSGLENGDTVITSGVLQIRPGVPVTISALDN
jgi:membrane fusion protein, multidrug efflux system